MTPLRSASSSVRCSLRLAGIRAARSSSKKCRNIAYSYSRLRPGASWVFLQPEEDSAHELGKREACACDRGNADHRPRYFHGLPGPWRGGEAYRDECFGG